MLLVWVGHSCPTPLKLFDKMENATRSPRLVVAYPDSVLTPPSEPVLACTRPCTSTPLKRFEREPSVPDSNRAAAVSLEPHIVPSSMVAEGRQGVPWTPSQVRAELLSIRGLLVV